MLALLGAQVLLLMIAHLLGDFYGSFYGPMVPELRARFGLSLAMTGTLATVYFTCSNYLQPFFGILGERYGRRKLMAGGIFLAAVGMSLLGVVRSFPLICMALAVGGMGVGMFHPCGAAIAGRSGGTRRSAAISLYMVGGNFGVMLAPLVIPRVMQHGLEWVALLVIPGLLFAVMLGTRLHREATQPAASALTHVTGLGRIFRRIWPIHLDVILRFIPVNAYAIMLPLYGTLGGLNAVQAGDSLALFMFGGAAGVMAGGYAAERLDNRPMLVVSELIAGVCLVLAPMTAGWLFNALLVAGGFLVYSSTPMQIASAQRLAPKTESTASGIVMGVAYGNAALVLIPLGTLGDHFRVVTGSDLTAVRWVLQLSASTLFLAALASLLLRPRPPSDNASTV